MAEAYCVKCKKQSKMVNDKKITTKNGRHAITGNCHKCGTKMYKFVKASK